MVSSTTLIQHATCCKQYTAMTIITSDMLPDKEHLERKKKKPGIQHILQHCENGVQLYRTSSSMKQVSETEYQAHFHNQEVTEQMNSQKLVLLASCNAS